MSFLPQEDQAWLKQSGHSYEEVAELDKRGVVLHAVRLPAGKFQVECADLLIQIPPGYPDANLDMFYSSPTLCLASSGRAPSATLVEQHFGKPWQRWSRHYKTGQWRSGIDDLATHMTMIYRSLREAA